VRVRVPIHRHKRVSVRARDRDCRMQSHRLQSARGREREREREDRQRERERERVELHNYTITSFALRSLLGSRVCAERCAATNWANVSRDFGTSDGTLHMSSKGNMYLSPFASVTVFVAASKWTGWALSHSHLPKSPNLDPRTCRDEIIQSYRRVDGLGSGMAAAFLCSEINKLARQHCKARDSREPTPISTQTPTHKHNVSLSAVRTRVTNSCRNACH